MYYRGTEATMPPVISGGAGCVSRRTETTMPFVTSGGSGCVSLTIASFSAQSHGTYGMRVSLKH